MEKRPIDIVLALAIEAIEKREAHDEDCEHYRAAVAKARRAVGSLDNGVKAVKLSGAFRLPDTEEVNSVRAVVDANPAEPHRVGVFLSNQKAFYFRRKWTASGYFAWTKMAAPGRHEVFAQKVS